MDYMYVGWGPEVDPDDEIVRPGDVRDFYEQPTWGRWAALRTRPETDEGDPEPPGPQEASPAATGAAPAPSLTAPPVKGF